VKRVIAVAPASFRFAALASINRDDSITGITFAHSCDAPDHDYARMLDDKVAAFRRRLPSAELMFDTDEAVEILGRFSRARVRA
jgi:hypothetical protein